MKKLGSLLIDTEKVIKNEELINLKGGDPPGSPCCKCMIGETFVGYIVGSTSADCTEDCKAVYGSTASGIWRC